VQVVCNINTIVLKKPPYSLRKSRNYHVNQKKRRTYTVEFYEELTVKINPKGPYQQLLNLCKKRKLVADSYSH
jgi:hypothetical protein